MFSSFFGSRSVASITGKLRKIATELDTHAEASRRLEDFHRGQAQEHEAFADNHLTEAQSANRVRDKIESLIA